MATHPATQQILRFFVTDHLREGPIANMGNRMADFAHELDRYFDENEITDPEITAGFRKLLESKDCFVRAVVEHANKQE